jgi:hypothetical protein
LRVAITTHQIAPLKGIAFMVMSAFMMNLNNAVLKLMAEGFPIGQIIFMRAVFVLVAPLFVLVWINGGWDALRVNDLKVHLLRAAFSA